ncbi:MAG: hypothetical protein JWP61_531 [Friedmanniella sp.]|nr:hypothetical protein [Friedmanniella sp.]
MALSFLGLVGLVGCAASPGGVPGAPSASTSPAGPVTPTAATPPGSTPSVRPTPSSVATPAARASGSYGVEKVAWPGTLTPARTVLSAMPRRLDGVARHSYLNDGRGEDPPARDTGVSYGSTRAVTVFEEYSSRDTPSGKRELMSANNLLSAGFGLVFACSPGSYRGTAPRPVNRYGGPGVTAKPLTKPVWFACHVAGAEGQDDFQGEAVGWTSGKLAWLVIGPSPAATQQLVTRLRAAV